MRKSIVIEELCVIWCRDRCCLHLRDEKKCIKLHDMLNAIQTEQKIQEREREELPVNKWQSGLMDWITLTLRNFETNRTGIVETAMNMMEKIEEEVKSALELIEKVQKESKKEEKEEKNWQEELISWITQILHDFILEGPIETTKKIYHKIGEEIKQAVDEMGMGSPRQYDAKIKVFEKRGIKA